MQELAVQGLRSNMQQVEQFMQEAVQQLQPAAGSPHRSPLETCHLVEGLSESHQAVLLPRLEGYEAACARFCQRCLDGKVQLLPASGSLQQHLGVGVLAVCLPPDNHRGGAPPYPVHPAVNIHGQ